MKACPFCNLGNAESPAVPDTRDVKPSVGWLRRAWRKVQWLFPTTLLVLMPKCPMCAAAYVAMATGVGVSVSTARGIQIGMAALCVLSLMYLAIRQWRGRRIRQQND